MSRRQHGSPWPSPANHLYRPSFRVGLQGYILYRHRAILPGRPAFVRPCEGVHRGKSLMTSSPLLQQWPACLVRLTWIVFVMGVRWPYSCCFVGCCFQDLLNIARSILVQLSSSFFSRRWVSVHAVSARPLLGKIAFYFIGQVWLLFDR